LYGPYHHLLNIRVSDWSACHEEWIVASITAQEIDEDLTGVGAYVSDLVGGSEGASMASKTLDFGESLITEEIIAKMEEEGYFKARQAKPPSAREVMPYPS
jgi:hypothetical protein